MWSRVSFVYLQKFTLKPWDEPASMKMLAPDEKTRSRALRTTTAPTQGCSNRRRSTASASSMSTPRS